MPVGSTMSRFGRSMSRNRVTVFGIIIVIALLGVGIYVFLNIRAITTGMPSFLSITLTIIAGVVVLLSILVLASYVLDSIGLSSQSDALGLPSGSVRAIIALSLILIFAILAIFMFQYLATPTQTITITTFTNSTVGNQTITNSTTTTSSTPSQAAIDFSKQTLTTVSTLVVAIAAFYFGTKTALEAKGKEGEEGEECDLSIDPEKIDWVIGGEPIIISAWPTPKDAVVTCDVIGDKPETAVVLVPNKKFKYTPSLTEPKEVYLTFKIPNTDVKPIKATINILKPSFSIDPSPTKDQKMKKGTPLTIKVTSTPNDAKIELQVDGDDKDKSIVVKTPFKEFEYKPTIDEGEVTVKFKMTDYPKVDEQTLHIKISKN